MTNCSVSLIRRMHHWRLINKLAPCLKFHEHGKNYSRQVERGEFDPDIETPYFSMKNRNAPSISVDTLALLHRNTITWGEVKTWYKLKKEREMRHSQRYIPERHSILGPDLAAAHFITFRGGKVKLSHTDTWLTYESITSNEIPSSFTPNMYLEAVDASDTKLCYEGLDNFVQLYHLKELILRNCSYIDDWCLHRLNAFESSLEHLDISGCHDVTERGICTLHSLKKLKTLILNNTPNIRNKELACLLLQEVLPQVNIIGVDYENSSLWENLKSYLK